MRALAKVFRGTYLAALQRAVDRGDLPLTAALAPLEDAAAFRAWLDELRQQAWVVYCKPPFAGPEHVLAYLGRYTHRVAISNERLLSLADGRVRFRWRDYADGHRVKVMDLEVDEFLRRFLLHIVPDGFVRIRHFGLLANRSRQVAIATCRALLAAAPPRAGVPSRPDAAPHWPRHRPLPRLPAGPPPPAGRPAPGARPLEHVMTRPSPTDGSFRLLPPARPARGRHVPASRVARFPVPDPPPAIESPYDLARRGSIRHEARRIET